MKLEYLWLALGIIFTLMGLYDIVVYDSLRSILTRAVGLLVTYTSLRNMGGWQMVLMDLKRRFK